jgi:2-dehydro-3-deoxyphosphogluconate aldolase / (4S)-4-hydroxy-2-oxoglutarate aldolase
VSAPEQMELTDVCAVIGAARLLPVLRVASADQALALTERLVDAGLPAVELTATTACWADAVAALRARADDLVVGAGTITTADDARAAVDAGAHFLVSPYPAPAVRPVADAAGIPFIEGGYTPGEVADAASRGVAKLFPAHVGGPTFLRSLSAVLPSARIIPTGGIRLTDVGTWLAAGAFAVGVGSDLTAPGDIRSRVEQALEGLG